MNDILTDYSKHETAIRRRLEKLGRALAHDSKIQVMYARHCAQGSPACSIVEKKQIFIDSCNPVEPDAVRNLIMAKAKLYHELAHILFTRNGKYEQELGARLLQDGFDQTAFFKLCNILEDGRIERILFTHFPGMRPYINYVVSYFGKPTSPLSDLILRVRYDKYQLPESKEYFAPVEALIVKAVASRTSKGCYDAADQIMRTLRLQRDYSLPAHCIPQGTPEPEQAEPESNDTAEASDNDESTDTQAAEAGDTGDNDKAEPEQSNSDDDAQGAQGESSEAGDASEAGDDNDASGNNASASDSDDDDDNDAQGDASENDDDDNEAYGTGAGVSVLDKAQASDNSEPEPKPKAEPKEPKLQGDAIREAIAEKLREDILKEIADFDQDIAVAKFAKNLPDQPFKDSAEYAEASKLADILKQLNAQHKQLRFNPSRRTGRIDSAKIANVVTQGEFLKRKSQSPDKRPAIAVLVDVSGSMFSGTYRTGKTAPIDHAMRVARIINGAMREAKLYASILYYGGTVEAVEKVTLERPQSEGSTNTAQAMVYAARSLKEREEPRKVCFVITDGEAGDYRYFPKAQIAMAEAGVFVVGIVIGNKRSFRTYAYQPFKACCNFIFDTPDGADLTDKIVGIVHEFTK